MKKRILTAFLALMFGLSAAFIAPADVINAQSSGYIDNSSLLPKYIPDSQVTLDENGSPSWVDDLIIVAANLHQVLDEENGETLKTKNNSAIKLLDHIAEMGANCLWLTPVYDRSTNANGQPKGNGYSNLGPHTIDKRLTGEDDYTKGWQVLKSYIDEAHKRNIRVILDVVSWGLLSESNVYAEHPDWFSSANDFDCFFAWGDRGWFYDDDTTPDLKEWFVRQLVNVALTTGCDGFRYDCEPGYAGPLVHAEVKNRLLKSGRKILSMSEVTNDRAGAYDLEQGGVCAPDELDARDAFNYLEETPLLKYYNIVDCIKQGEHIGSYYSRVDGEGAFYKYYTHQVSNHDFFQYNSKGNRLVMGYQAIYSPFIPLWYIGEETVSTKKPGVAVLYDSPVTWEKDLKDPTKRAFYEDVKAMIRVRRTYSDLFVNFPGRFIDTNICKVNVDNCENIQPYARYINNTAAIVVPNYNIHNPNAVMKVHMPFKATGLGSYRYYKVTDIETGEVIVSGTKDKVATFEVTVPANDQRVFLVTAEGKIAAASTETEVQKTDKDNVGESGGDKVTAETEKTQENENIQDEENIQETEDGKKTTQKKVIVTKKKKKASSDSVEVWPFIAGGAAAVVVAAGAVTFVLVKKRRKKKGD